MLINPAEVHKMFYGPSVIYELTQIFEIMRAMKQGSITDSHKEIIGITRQIFVYETVSKIIAGVAAADPSRAEIWFTSIADEIVRFDKKDGSYSRYFAWGLARGLFAAGICLDEKVKGGYYSKSLTDAIVWLSACQGPYIPSDEIFESKQDFIEKGSFNAYQNLLGTAIKNWVRASDIKIENRQKQITAIMRHYNQLRSAGNIQSKFAFGEMIIKQLAYAQFGNMSTYQLALLVGTAP